MAEYLANTAESMSQSVAVLDSVKPQPRVKTPSLYSASVQVTSFTDAAMSVNPHPWSSSSAQGPEYSGRGKEGLSQDYLSPLQLVQITGEPDLKRVTYLELSIDTTENSRGNYGAYLPNMTQLRLSNSLVPCVRDLGTSLSSLKILWMTRCKLKDLDGLPALQNLQEFYLAFNDVEDISVVTMLSSLEVLDLESNNLSERDQLGYLAICPSLISVTLEGNPLSNTIAQAAGSESGYRAVISKAIPGIKILNLVPLEQEKMDVSDGGLMSQSTLFSVSDTGTEKDWHILQSSIKQGLQMGEENVSISSLTSNRPKTAPSQRSISSSPPSTRTPVSAVDGSSELTHGLNQVICGNPVRALRARKQHGLTSPSGVKVPPADSSQSEKDLHFRLQEWTLDPVYEDGITITRTKSEEKLFFDAVAQQPDYLSTPKRTPLSTDTRPTPPRTSPPTIKRLPTPPRTSPPTIKRLPTPPKTSPPILKRLPTPPTSTDPTPARPKSVADFRHRRYRKLSTDNPQRKENAYDANFPPNTSLSKSHNGTIS